MNLVNVITVWHNREHAVESSIASLIQQNFHSFGILAIDDGSTDGTHCELLRMKQQAKLEGIEMIVHRQSNIGFTKSLANAIRLSSGSKYIALQDGGDFSLPNRLGEQFELAESSRAPLVGCWVQIESPDGVVRNVRRPPPTDWHRLEDAYVARPGTHGAAFFRRTDYLAAGGYRPGFYFSQDTDLWLRLCREAPVRNCQNTLYRRVEFQNSVSKSTLKRSSQKMFSTVAIQIARADANEADSLYQKMLSRGVRNVVSWGLFFEREVLRTRGLRRVQGFVRLLVAISGAKPKAG